MATADFEVVFSAGLAVFVVFAATGLAVVLGTDFAAAFFATGLVAIFVAGLTGDLAAPLAADFAGDAGLAAGLEVGFVSVFLLVSVFFTATSVFFADGFGSAFLTSG